MFAWINKFRRNRLERKIAYLIEQLNAYEEMRHRRPALGFGDIDYHYSIPDKRAQLAAYKTKYYQLSINK